MSERNVRYGAAEGPGRRIVEVPVSKDARSRSQGAAQGAGAVTAAGGGLALHASRKVGAAAASQGRKREFHQHMVNATLKDPPYDHPLGGFRTEAETTAHNTRNNERWHATISEHAAATTRAHHHAERLGRESRSLKRAGKIAIPAGLATVAAGSIPKRKTSKSLIGKAVWTPTSVLAGAKKLGSTFATGMKDAQAGMHAAPLGGGVRGQRAAQAMGSVAGKATSTPGRTMGTIGGAATVGALGGAAMSPKQPKSAALGGKGTAIRRAKIVARAGPGFGGPATGSLHVTANGTDLKGKHFDMRNAGVDEIKRRTRSHPVPGFTPYKNKLRMEGLDTKVESSHRGWHKAPGPYVAAGGAGGIAALAHAQPDKKETKAAAYTRDIKAPPSRPPRSAPRREFDPEARRQRHVGEAMAGSTAVGAVAGGSAISAQRKHLRGIREANYAQDAAHYRSTTAYNNRAAKLKAAGKKVRAAEPVRPDKIARTIKPGALGRAAVATGALGVAETLRRKANDPNSRIHDRWN